VKRKRLFITATAAFFGCLVFLAAAAFFLLQSPSLVNAMAASLEGWTGYRVHVQDISFGWHKGIDVRGLEVRDTKTGAFHLLLASAEVKSRIGGVGLEVERIVLTHPRFVFRLKKGGGQTSPFEALEKLPPVRLLVIQDAKLELTTDTERFSLPGVHLSVRDFSPKSGGTLKAEGFFDATTRGVRGAGRFEASLAMSRFSPAPSGKGSLDLSLDTGSFGQVALEKGRLASRIEFAGERISLSGMRLTAARVASTAGKQEVAAHEIDIGSDISYDQRTSRFSITGLRGRGAGLGALHAELTGTVAPLSWSGAAEASSIDLPGVFAMVRPLLPAEYRLWTFKGRGAIRVRSQGSAGDNPTWNADVAIDFQDGGFASPDNFKAGDRIEGQVRLKMESPRKEQKGKIDLTASAGEGEILWGKYYRDFKGRNAGISLKGEFTSQPVYATGAGLLDLFHTGRYSFSGELSPRETRLSMEGTGVSFQSLFGELFSDYVHQNHPGIGDMKVGGVSDFNVSVRISGDSMAAKGKLEIRDASLALPDRDVMVEGLRVSLPFNLTYPPPGSLSTLDGGQGNVSVERIKGGRLETGRISLPLLLSQNTLIVPAQLDFPAYGGTFSLTHFRMDGLLGKTRLDTGIALDRVDLGELTQSLSPVKVEGTIDGALTSIRWEGDEWKTRGKVEASVFGGRVELSRISAREPFARSRSISGNILFDGIDLEQMTSKIEVGKMTGIVRGSIEDLTIDYGQPSRFVLDIETDPNRKAARTISVDAIENISILGTGTSAVSAILNSGVRKFFKAYPYSRIGIQCTLENDVFVLRGTIREGGKEYLVRRSLLRGIDVVNQNPDNSISFKDMQERVGRIFRPKQEPKNVSS
jgi:hypothetical protein